MVRVLMIRHAESLDNVQMAERLIDKRSGVSDHEVVRQLYENDAEETDWDAPLSARGHEQAEQLAAYWAPVLAQKRAEGKLHFFCSPFHRNLETADPLMRALGMPPGSVELNVEIMEQGGIVHPTDLHKVAQLPSGALFGLGGDALAAKCEWAAAGLTADQIRAKFPWVAIDNFLAAAGTDERVSASSAAPGYAGGLEGLGRATARIHALHEWLRRLAVELPADAMVGFVSHGDTMNMLVRISFEPHALLTLGQNHPTKDMGSLAYDCSLHRRCASWFSASLQAISRPAAKGTACTSPPSTTPR